jgi:hypothetical protein
METITITLNKSLHHRRTYKINSNLKFFSNNIIIKYQEDIKKISFYLCTSIFIGRTRKATKLNSNFVLNFTPENELPLGKFYFDKEESNEDCMVFYLDEESKVV